MHDVIIDDTQSSFIVSSQMEQRKENIKKEIKPKKTEKLSQYLIDWIEKALIVALLISLDFLIYIGSGSYNMFLNYTILTPEVWYIIAGIFTLSFILIYCLSFFKFLQNLVVAGSVYYFVIVMLNQFAAFDKNAMLASLTATYISQDLGLLLTYVSHIIVALTIAFISFIFISFASKLNIFWLLLFLIFCNFSVIFTQFIDKNEHQKFNVLKEEVIPMQAKSGKKFIYIGLNGLSSFSYFDDMIKSLPEKSSELEDIKKTQDVMLGFYSQNGFHLYPQSYVNFETPDKNFAKILNANSKKNESDYVLQNVYPESFWRFNRVNKKDTYLKESRIYKTFKKGKFNINTYQSSGIELCKINNEMSVHRCVERNSLPIDFDNMKITTFQKIEIILAQWIESMGIFNDYSSLYTILRPFTKVDNLPLVGVSYKNLSIKNSADVLDIVAQDIGKTNGNTAFFVNIDMPGDTYIYDEYCQIKPINTWINKDNLPWAKNINISEKRKAYMQQLRCVYGKLQNFVDQVNKETKQNDIVIFIQGLSGLNGLEVQKQDSTFIDEFMNKNFVDSAVKDPLKKDFQVKNESCSASDILVEYLYRKKQCSEFNLNIEENLKEKIINQLNSYSIKQDRIEKATQYFKNWYQEWLKKQNSNILPKDKGKITPKTEEKPEKKENKPEEKISEQKVEKAPEVTTTISEPSEVVTKPLTKEIEEKAEATEKENAVENKEENKEANK